MSTQRRIWCVIAIIGVITLTMGCVFPSMQPQAQTATVTGQPSFAATLLSSSSVSTSTPDLPVGAKNAGSGSGSGSAGAGAGSGGTGGGSGNSGGSNNNSGSEPSSTPTQAIDLTSGPYVVKQIETLGGEVISGVVCNLTQPFSVASQTPKAAFLFQFAPQDAQKGKVAYAYSIPSAGESHEAGGSYSISSISPDGTLQLSLTVSDHVVFKGFDGNIPNRYKFNLVPTGNVPCPPAH